MWDSRRILKELADAPRRQKILEAFWQHAEPHTKALASAHLARAMRFRDESIRKASAQKKAEYLGSRISAPEMEEFAELALMLYHTHEANGMMGSFLDAWGVPHKNGEIESDEYTTPTADAVRQSMTDVAGPFERRDAVIYLATAGLLMGDAWREATWPVVDELAPALA